MSEGWESYLPIWIGDAPEWKYRILGCRISASKSYRGRYECHFYGKRGAEIKVWLRDQFGNEDDMVYNSYEIDGSSLGHGCEALINEGELLALLLRWS